MELVLHVVDEDGFVNLDGVAEPGTHYKAARNDETGVVRLTPVRVATTVRKQPAPAADDQPTTEAPWPA